MGGILGSILDIISDVIDAIVDIVETIVDIIVDIVEAIVDVVAGLLGWDDSQTIEQFEVHNQALFEDPDRTSLAEVVKNSVIRNEDIASNILFSEVFQSGKKNIRQFVNHIDDNKYFEDFPTVQANIMYIDYTEITSELNTLQGTPCTIEYASLGTLFVPTWIKYWLQENKSYNVTANTIVYSGSTYNVDVYASTYNSSTDDYTLQFSSTTSTVVPSYKVPTKPTDLHYIVNYHKDSVPLSTILFVYEVGDGTYPDLDDPTLDFGDAGSTDLRLLPAVPLRTNNVNFDATASTKATKIADTVKILGFKADEMIDAVMEDVADAGITDYNNKVDHVFLNFGVRIWDTSQIGINYLYRFMSVLYANQGTTEGIYNATPSADEKPYNSVIVTASDYKSVFKFAYIKFQHNTLAEIDADSSSLINAAYYSNLAKFTSGAPGNNDLISTYYVSSGNPGYNVGYKASNTTQVSAFLAGTLTQESGYTTEAADWLQPTQRITYTASLLNADGTTNSSGVLKPDNVYQKDSATSIEEHDADSWGYAYYETFAPSDNIDSVSVKVRRSSSACTLGYSFGITSGDSGIWVNHGCRATFNVHYAGAGGLKLVNRAEEVTTQGQSFIFYQCVTNGINAYTVQAPISMLRVVDAATTKFKMVKFNIANQNDLMVPFSYDLVKDLPNSHVSSLFMASAHISLYVAHYEVIEVPFWVKLLKIIAVVLLIIAIVTFDPATFDLAMAIEEMITQMLIKEVIVYIASEISPELAFVVGVFLGWKYGMGTGMDFDALTFLDFAKLFAGFADILSTVILVIVDQDLGAIEREHTEGLAKYNAGIDDISEIRKDLRLDANGEYIPWINESVRGTINPMDCSRYIAMSVTSFNQIGFADFDYEQKINNVFKISQFGVA